MRNKALPYWSTINHKRSLKMAKPETKQPRKVEEIQQEYNQLCAQLGERQFQIEIFKAEIQKGNQRILEIGKEMQAAQEQAATQPPQEPVQEPVSLGAKDEVK